MRRLVLTSLSAIVPLAAACASPMVPEEDCEEPPEEGEECACNDWVESAPTAAFLLPPPPVEDEGSWSFGVVADIQYAIGEPEDGWGANGSLDVVREAVDGLNGRNLRFTVQLGDFVNTGADSMEAVLGVTADLDHFLAHTLGNHDFGDYRTGCVGRRRVVMQMLDLEHGYYSFTHRNLQVIVLDSMDIAVSGGWPSESENRAAAFRMLAELEAAGAENFVTANGAVGPEQLAYLDSQLEEADREGRRVVLTTHVPLVGSAGNLLMWNREEVLAVLETHPSVVAVFAGHVHVGDHTLRAGIHHVTVEAMDHWGAENGYGIVEVFDDRLVVHGVGVVTSRTLEFF